MKKRHMFLLLASLLLAGCTQSGNSEVVDPSEENPSKKAIITLPK